jgi:hypothetical protein
MKLRQHKRKLIARVLAFHRALRRLKIEALAIITEELMLESEPKA